MKNQLVIARYDEDIQWLNKWKNTFDIIVYNKGEYLDCEFKQIKLKNYGREARTHLHHIITNYDNLYENTVFLQGSISESHEINAAHQDLNQYIVEIEKNGFSAKNMTLHDSSIWNDINFHNVYPYSEQIPTGVFRFSKIKFRDYVQKYLGKVPEKVIVSWRGCFGVRKDGVNISFTKIISKCTI